MDVHCSTCGEPWDVYHLWHDAIFETGWSRMDTVLQNAIPAFLEARKAARCLIFAFSLRS